MSDPVDKHLDKALASLGDVPARELHATSDAIGRRSPLHDFAGVFREVAYSRKDGADPHLADFHLRQAVERGRGELADQIAEAEAPFWRHVREALRAHQDLLASLDEEAELIQPATPPRLSSSKHRAQRRKPPDSGFSPVPFDPLATCGAPNRERCPSARIA